MKLLKTLLLVTLLSHLTFSQGTVYLVLGSDTAIWEGMGTSTFNDLYNISLYSDPNLNGHKVMDPSFRIPLKDSYGTPMKLTWWMMAGNIFRYARNTNVPINNIMTLYLMKKYNLQKIQEYGDELTLHYHTFKFYDYDGDGKSWWNQAQHFSDCREDFDFTVAQFLLEENVFPVSFRSGWHAMDNGWQSYLNDILPYSLHSDYPAIRKDTLEPLDNIFDWSKTTSKWVPFRPSPYDYQMDGNGRGWNVRSKHISAVNQTLMNNMFNEAKAGKDQLACLWGHLPEENFLTNLARIDSIAHQAEKLYNVKFKYCTAVEAYKLYRKTEDNTAPQLTIEEVNSGDNISYVIKTDETIFQKRPFVAVKDVYDNYFLLKSTLNAANTWTTDQLKKSIVAKIGVAVTDTFGNLSTKFIQYINNDTYIDEKSSDYFEVKGSFSTNENIYNWEKFGRYSNIIDTSKIKINLDSLKSGYYNIFYGIPRTFTNHSRIKISHFENDLLKSSKIIDSIKIDKLNYLNLITIDSSKNNSLLIEGLDSGKVFAFDILKLSPLVAEKRIHVNNNPMNLGDIIKNDTTLIKITLENRGSSALSISSVIVKDLNINHANALPIILASGESKTITLRYVPQELGAIDGVITFISDDPVYHNYEVNIKASVQPYFRIIDNEDSSFYSEIGSWNKSVTQAYGLTSRYHAVNLTSNPKAIFSTQLDVEGNYDIYQIVPVTVNSIVAKYTLFVNNVEKKSVEVDQNIGSGVWQKIMKVNLPKNTPIKIELTKVTQSSASVLRADAVMFKQDENYINNIFEETGELSFELNQNYPNPFNPSTNISFTLPAQELVELKIYDILGKEVLSILSNQVLEQGFHSYNISFSDLASGIYIYKLKAGANISSKKMVFLK